MIDVTELRWGDEKPFEAIVGKTIAAIERDDDVELRFAFSDGSVARMAHSQDCCETVEIAEIHGELADLIGSPLLVAEEAVSNTDPEGYKRDYSPESATWTFYKLSTLHASVTIRWLGESNGYYSERVDFQMRGPA